MEEDKEDKRIQTRQDKQDKQDKQDNLKQDKDELELGLWMHKTDIDERLERYILCKNKLK